ncbi:MAG: ABC transporter, substrate-binding protein (cluster 5, nickel/peptides/opines) [uncultured Thermomicrobiales bacterium]|uniref:ABC transporter, substrate-binding protein (Cluster 5, nickel/peptides/opines) n=1 Tax=uncultured Thermomicrobiales bacterium TaxID=1645740 RepID=A0A6J4TMI2_9BACT|nr:MAG: ABC transporter, substrate-binding protein (cluster 5, nickel/peptides/opines) [uncultured Thermomicrobiales bacterium]
MADVQQPQEGKFGRLYGELRAGKLSRREFTQRALALGVGLPVITFVANAARVSASGKPSRNGWAAIAQDGAAAPAVGVEGQTRGAGGELKLLLWQAVTQLVPHTLTGTKDFIASSLVFEPPLNYLEDGTLIPNLAAEVPTVENGLLAEDLTSVTVRLKEGVTWSDGTPLTSEDLVFTHQWINDPENASVSLEIWGIVESVEAVDELTAKFTFKAPAANWFEPITGTQFGLIIPAHALGTGTDAIAEFTNNPIGTGPFMVESFAPNDQVIYVANPSYREPNKPFFDRVNLKGGGDAASAARAVLQTGDWDYAWNLQVEPAILAQLEQGGQGKLIAVPGTSVERINVNFSDPNAEVDGQRSHKDSPHPFLSDLNVRKAMALAVDRATITEEFYGYGALPGKNILAGISSLESPNTTNEYNLDAANQLLDEAGWTRDGDRRSKDGVELRVVYATSINAVRQKTQAVVKEGLEELGFQVQLQQVDSGIYFDGSAGNEQNINHMYVDINMYTNGAGSPIPLSYMTGWYAGPEDRNIAQQSNAWSGQNYQRYRNPEFDALYEQVILETDVEASAQILIQMNDILINDVAVIPEVNRPNEVAAISNRLREENLMLGPGFEVVTWNIANWNTNEG